MDYRSLFAVPPGAPFDLAARDPGYGDPRLDKAAAQPLIEKNRERLSDLQARLYAEGRRAVLICLQGMDTAGKDGVVTQILRVLNPLGCTVHGFKTPSEVERAHDFLWRAHAAVPAKGWIGIFNRTYYEAVLIEKVHKLAPEDAIAQRYRQIADFERLLAETGTVVVKFFLHISKDEQLERFKKRLDDPAKQWKISAADYAERGWWDAYQSAYQIALEKCSTAEAPWHVIPANRKWFRDLAVSDILAETMDKMDIKAPQPSVDLEKIRLEYHAAAKKL